MSSQRQIEANRRNAQKSTGPTSVAGKAASSMNALKTGIHAELLVIYDEKAEDLQTLVDEYYAECAPVTHEKSSVSANTLLVRDANGCCASPAVKNPVTVTKGSPAAVALLPE